MDEKSGVREAGRTPTTGQNRQNRHMKHGLHECYFEFPFKYWWVYMLGCPFGDARNINPASHEPSLVEAIAFDSCRDLRKELRGLRK